MDRLNCNNDAIQLWISEFVKYPECANTALVKRSKLFRYYLINVNWFTRSYFPYLMYSLSITPGCNEKSILLLAPPRGKTSGCESTPLLTPPSPASQVVLSIFSAVTAEVRSTFQEFFVSKTLLRS